MPTLHTPLTFAHGPALKNRFVLAPLTNCQSHADGTISDDELRFLEWRAKGGFGLTMTCASHVQAQGQGFAGQLGIWSDAHLPGLTRLASALKAHDSIAVVQLHHAGMRAPREVIGGAPVCPSDDAETGARALSLAEVHDLREAFIDAAVRADRAGFDGVELHGAHGYVLCQFLSDEINRRTDEYGGSFENRSRLIQQILDGIRERCRPDFNVGIRLSPERFGMKLGEIRDYVQQLMRSGQVDYIDLSLWDVFKAPMDEAYQQRSLLDWFTDLERGNVRLGAAGKIMTAADARHFLELGLDFAVLGRAAILHHDFPRRTAADPDFTSTPLPVDPDYLRAEGLGESFVEYMKRFKGFLAA
jgi:2,4-dienoyl-CoA reductase-like NADH-dependent reductase (Old Yellow Enzyme family)